MPELTETERRDRRGSADDRGRIARDLHDHVIEPLNATGHDLHETTVLGASPEVNARIMMAVDDIDLSIAQIRCAIFALTADDSVDRSTLHAPAHITVDPRIVSLSPRERQILALVAEGLTNREIGKRLMLAEKTVKNYVSTMLSKLGMHRRTQAAVLFAHSA